jgi:hypothetical protein
MSSRKRGCPELFQRVAERKNLSGTGLSLCPQDLASKLREAEETQSTLQAECDQYRTILAGLLGRRAIGPIE